MIAIVLAVLLFFRRSWWPHGAVLGEVDGLDGWHSVDVLRRRPRACRASSSTAGRRRCSSPTRARSATRSATSCASGSPRGSCVQCEAITDVDVTAAGDARAARQGAQRRRACTWRSSRCAPGSRSSSQRYGLLETLDRDHFYPSVEDGARGDPSRRTSDERPSDGRVSTPPAASPRWSRSRARSCSPSTVVVHPVPPRRRASSLGLVGLVPRGRRRLVVRHGADAAPGDRRSSGSWSASSLIVVAIAMRARRRRPRSCPRSLLVVVAARRHARVRARAAMLRDLHHLDVARTRGRSAAPCRSCSATRGPAAARSSSSVSSTSPASSASRR